MANRFHPDLAAARWIPRFSYGPRLARFLHGMTPRPKDPGEGNIWMVVHDNRTGAAFITFPLHIQ